MLRSLVRVLSLCVSYARALTDKAPMSPLPHAATRGGFFVRDCGTHRRRCPPQQHFFEFAAFNRTIFAICRNIGARGVPVSSRMVCPSHALPLYRWGYERGCRFSLPFHFPLLHMAGRPWPPSRSTPVWSS